MRHPRLRLRALTALIALLASATTAHAFCGFYVGKAGAELFNEASQVVLARDGDRTVVTMSNDWKGNLTEFALVVPVPSVISKEQIHVGDRRFVERIDAYSSPRLAEYYDPDPCAARHSDCAGCGFGLAMSPRPAAMAAPREERGRALGVTVEAEYTVGEYDIVILSAKQSEGLETWLRESGYNIPARAASALGPYIKQDMKFFVARVNLKEHKAGGFTYLRPIQIAYESAKFMLPIRLGMANARGPQDLVVYALTRKGRVESTNYRTVKVPSNLDIPTFVQGSFASFYKAVFARAWEREDKRAVHTEYVWDTGWCDPCSATPPTAEELRGLGAFWVDGGGGAGTVLTRLHVRYDGQHFPEDLVFQETGDRENFQARYVLHQPFRGDLQCAAGREYTRELDKRHVDEARTLAKLTGWSESTIHGRMGIDAPHHEVIVPWWKKLWP